MNPSNVLYKKPLQQQAFKSSVTTEPLQYAQVPLTQNYPIQPKIPQNYTKTATIKSPYGDDIHLYMLNNGQKVAIMPKKGTTIVKTVVNSGSMNETDDKRGISHFIEHNLFNGSDKLDAEQFFKEVSNMGAYTNASTGLAQTDYYVLSSMMREEDLAKTIEMHADMIQNPRFAPEMIEKEKGPVTSEISMMGDVIFSSVNSHVLKNLFQINSDSKELVGGSIKTVNSINREDVVDYHRRHYTPDNLTTVVVGDVDPEKTMELISRNFNAPAVSNATSLRTSQNLVPIQKPVRVDYISPKDNAAFIISAFSGPKMSDTKEKVALDLLSHLLLDGASARLGKNLRTINANAFMEIERVGLKPDDPSMLNFSIEAPKNTEQKALDMLYEALEDVKQNPPTQDEMTIVKKALNKQLALMYQDSASICEIIGQSVMNGNISAITDEKKIIESITPQDLVDVAQKYFDLNKVSLGVIHPSGTTQDEIFNNYKEGKYRAEAALTRPTSFTGAVSFTGKTIDTSDVREMKLADNSYLAIGDSNSDVTYFDWKLTSYENIPKNLAIPYVLAAILNEGTSQKTKEQISLEAKLKGIDFGFSANSFSIKASANSLAENAPEAVAVLKEAMYNPRFQSDTFEIAKKKVADNCSAANKSAAEKLVSRLYPEFFSTSDRIAEGLKTVTLQDIVKYYNDLMISSSSNFAITAPIEKNPGLEHTLASAVNTNGHTFKTQKTHLNEVYKPKEESEVLVQTETRNQAQIYKSYSFKMSGNIEDEVKIELLDAILGSGSNSRLFQDLREKQKLAYAVRSQAQSFGDTGILKMYILTTTDDKAQGDIKHDNVQKSIDGFSKHTQALQDQPVSEVELENAKKALKRRLFQEMELPGSKNSLLLMNAGLPYGIKRIDEYFKAIDKMTVQDIQSAAKHIFANKPVYSILASPDTVENQLPYLESLGTVSQE